MVTFLYKEVDALALVFQEEMKKSARDSWDNRQCLLLKDRFDARIKCLELPGF